MKTVKLLYPYANVMGLMFPVGKLEDGGTCQFATKICLVKCCAHLPGSGRKISFERKREIYDYFLVNSPETITQQLLNELKEAGCEIFTWFATGDCPGFLTGKYFAVVKALDQKGIIQTGFTRNNELWRRCQKLSENSKILLTIEAISDAERAGMYSMPNYEIGAIDLVRVGTKKKHVSSGCGGGYYQDHIVKTGSDNSHFNLDCKACYKNKTGCFHEVKK